MTFVFLALLAIVWVVVLGSYARERMADRRTDSVSAFHSQLTTLQRTQNQGRSFDRRSRPELVAPRSVASLRCDTARRRRKNVLAGLLTVAVLLVLAALTATSAVTIGLAVLGVVAFTGYVALLVERQRLVTEQYAKVRPIGSARLQPAPPRPSPRRVASVASARR